MSNSERWVGCGRKLLVVLVVALTGSPFLAGGGSGLRFLQVQLENDDRLPVPYSEPSDRFYTNGLRVSWSTRETYPAYRLPFWARWVKSLTGGAAQVSPSSSIGQSFFTPEDITVSAPQPLDRPWAGWLYFGRMLAITTSAQTKHDIEFQVGVTGSASGAKFVQTEWHDIINSDPPAGWDNQLESELGSNYSYAYQRILSPDSSSETKWDLDLVPRLRVALGTIESGVGLGVTIRAGRNISGFPYDPIRPTLVARSPEDGRDRGEIYAFVGGEARYVAHNYFLEGSLFRNDPGVRPERFVWDFNFGVAARCGRIRFSYTVVRRAAEFERAAGASSGIHNFGSLSIAYEAWRSADVR